MSRRDKVTGDKRIATAGGLKQMKWQVSTHIPSLNLQVTCKAMTDCPPALSVGRLVLEQGCTFEWKPGGYPSLYLPCGRRVKLKVRRFVPILDAQLIATAMAGTDSEGSEDSDAEPSPSGQASTDLPDSDMDDDAVNTDVDAPPPLEQPAYSEDEDIGDLAAPDTPDADAPPSPPSYEFSPEDEFPDFDAFIPEDQRDVPERPPAPDLPDMREATRPGVERVEINEGEDSQGEWDENRDLVVPDGVLVQEAKSATHMLCHRPYNKHCAICRQRMQMGRPYGIR